MATLKFPNKADFKEYCKVIETFIKKDIPSKRLLGFHLYDQNNDGRICPIDCLNNMSILGVDPLHATKGRKEFSKYDTS